MTKNPFNYRFGQLERVEKAGWRFYVTPAGTFPSVTTVLSLGSDESWLEDWKARVGEEEAARVSARATRRGEAIHSFAEQYLLGETPRPSIVDREVWIAFKPFVQRISDVECLETRLYSSKLKVAGTVDCIGKFDGERAIIDFKTSRWGMKTDEDIHDYFLQESVYSFAYAELTASPPIKTLVTIIANDDLKPQLFVRPLKTSYIQDFIKYREKAELYFQQQGVL